MATFRAIHPYVREQAFELGFEPVPNDNYRVQHPRVRGKRAQVLFYKAFSQASKMPGVRKVAMPGTASGTTLLFPQVPESRWEAARRGVKWIEPKGTIHNKLKLVCLDGDAIRLTELADKMGIKGTDLLIRALSMGMAGVNLNTWLTAEEAEILAREFGFRIDTYRNYPLPGWKALLPPPTPPPRPRPKNLHFNGVIDSGGSLVTFQVTTTDDTTARRMLESLTLGTP